MTQQRLYVLVRRWLVWLSIVALLLAWPVQAQTPAPDDTPPIIDAQNVARLASMRQLDFEDLPPDLQPASGQFVATPHAEKVVTFARWPGKPPFSQAVLWGYLPDGGVATNTIDDSSVGRLLSEDGRCLYAGYRGYFTVWQLEPEAEAATAWLGPVRLPDSDATVVNFWLDDPTACQQSVYLEVAAPDGSTSIYHHTPDGDLTLLHQRVFTGDGQEVAARVGRIPPPLALTVDFEGVLRRWDMQTGQVTSEVALEQVALFGMLNAPGTHYVWQAAAYDGLHLVDFEAETDNIVVTYQDVYVAHLALNPAADVVLGIDPSDARGTVSAWPLATGERLDLGSYRACDRVQPDLARLTAAGTTLIIGCDKGIDIWQVQAPVSD